jgi:acetyltransferase-like isoleucine patch superfamily enzyme
MEDWREERKFLMTILTKIEKVIVFTLRNIISAFSPRTCTSFMTNYYRRRGMKIYGLPNFLAASIWLDGSDYSMIELNEGCTLSTEVRVFTHDWSLYTIGRGMGLKMDKPIGIFRPVRIGKYAFIGSGSILLPGADIGDGAIVGAGSVVRGQVPPWTIVVGSPAQPVGDSREFVCKNLSRMGLTELLREAQQVMGTAKESPPK